MAPMAAILEIYFAPSPEPKGQLTQNLEGIKCQDNNL